MICGLLSEPPNDHRCFVSDVTLGKLIDSTQQRDAIHIAVVPLIAGDILHRGSKFRLAFGTTDTALPGDYNDKGKANDAIGIVDPFLDEWQVKKGQRFWGVLFPGTVTGMRHEWQHPSFASVSQPRDDHERWLREFCDKWNFDFDELIEAGVGTADPEWRYATARGQDLHSASELDAGEETLFWDHMEGYTGQSFDDGHREKMMWSCTC